MNLKKFVIVEFPSIWLDNLRLECRKSSLFKILTLPILSLLHHSSLSCASALPYTVYNCSWHGMVSSRLASQQPGIITPVSKTFSPLGIYS
jgi:hypothetical protein